MPTHYAQPYSERPVPARFTPEIWQAWAAWVDEPNKEQAKIKYRRYREIKSQLNQSSTYSSSF